MEKAEIKLLIITPEDNLRNQLRSVLSDQFDQVIESTDGEDGFQKYRKLEPDLVICDVELPSLNGLDLLRKSRNIDLPGRVILLSRTKDSDILTDAIDLGAKGLLLKPLDLVHLQETVHRQIEKILARNSVRSEEKRRLHAEQQYDKSKRILQVVSTATTSFFQTDFTDHTINEVIKMIGEVTGSSRVYIYKNYIKDFEEYATRIFEWTADGIMPAIGNLPVTDKKIATSGFGRWVDVMKKHKGYITGNIRDFELIEQERLKEHGVKSILAIPIYTDNQWWGFLGLDNCKVEKKWSEPEISALEALAANLGAAIHKKTMDQQMLELNQSLEERVKERTRELEFEVAERTMAEALLKDSEEKYRLIYENATDGIMLIQGGKIVLVNPAIVEIFEDLPRNLIGKKFSQIVAKENRKIIKRQFKKDSGKMLQDLFHVKAELPGNRIIWLELKPTQVIWYGEPAQLVFVSNITPQMRAREELQALNETLEKRIEEEVHKVELQQQLLVQKSKLESIGELSAGLAHEINQPLVSISMGLDNMLMKLQQNGVNKKYLTTKMKLLFEDIDRIKNIIEHVRTFSRDQQNTILKKTTVSTVLLNALSLVQRQLTESNIKLELGCLGGELSVMGNPYKLEQVILNMISNARYAVEEKARKLNDRSYIKTINISCERKNDLAVLEITDNGIGIPEEVLPNIFDPFYTTKTEEKGTGLGLSISYGIIREMKGSIIAESIPYKHTTIKIELPLAT